MEVPREESRRFRDVLPIALIAMLPTFVGTAVGFGSGISNQGEEAQQAEHVVALLQETHGPTSIIVEQEAEAREHRGHIHSGEAVLAGALAFDGLLTLGIAGGILRFRRRMERGGGEQ